MSLQDDAAAEFRFLDDTTLGLLRGRWPGLHSTLCGGGDVPARLSPVLASPASTSIWSTAANTA